MKNVSEYQLKKCICLAHYEFDDIISIIFGGEVEAEYHMDGLWVGYNDGDKWLDEDELNEALARYFDVKEVTSIHIDDCETIIGVWICYKED